MKNLKVKTNEVHALPIKDLAIAMAEAEPQVFADFWLYFCNKCDEDKISLEKFGKAMADLSGLNRYNALVKIHDSMKYHYQVKSGKIF
jgi:thiol-disulfide isomerase/thioredoxin